MLGELVSYISCVVSKQLLWETMQLVTFLVHFYNSPSFPFFIYAKYDSSMWVPFGRMRNFSTWKRADSILNNTWKITWNRLVVVKFRSDAYILQTTLNKLSPRVMSHMKFIKCCPPLHTHTQHFIGGQTSYPFCCKRAKVFDHLDLNKTGFHPIFPNTNWIRNVRNRSE